MIGEIFKMEYKNNNSGNGEYDSQEDSLLPIEGEEFNEIESSDDGFPRNLKLSEINDLEDGRKEYVRLDFSEKEEGDLEDNVRIRTIRGFIGRK